MADGLGQLTSVDDAGFAATQAPGDTGVSVAIFSRPKHPHADRPMAGTTPRFTRTPFDFDDEFERAATPSREAILSAGMNTLDSDVLGNDGAWLVRLGKSHAYLCYQRHVSYSNKPVFLLDTTSAMQPGHVEQITFRFDLDDWATHAGTLSQQALDWVTRHPHGADSDCDPDFSILNTDLDVAAGSAKSTGCFVPRNLTTGHLTARLCRIQDWQRKVT